ncbi:MAG: glycosyltransferase family 4 protein [Balneolales bacterium]
MRILYFYQYFSTPRGSWGTRVYDFAKEWVEAGHKVTVVTSIYSKSDLKATKFIERQNIEGIDLIVLNIGIDNRQNPLKRIWTFLQYSFMSAYYALREPADVVISSSGPITVGVSGLLARYFRRRKFVFEVRDLWPDTAIVMGFIKKKWMQKLMYAFEGFCYRSAHLIVTLSPGMRENILKRYGKLNIESVTNAANLELFGNPNQKQLPTGVERGNYAIYTGNIGKVNNSELLFKTACILRDRGEDNLKIIMIGDGQQKEELIKKVEQENLGNWLQIRNLISKEDLVPMVQQSLASLIPLASTPLLDTSSPNKLFESLAAGVPVVQTTNGWIRDFLVEYNCGITIDSTQPEQLADELIKLKSDTDTWKEMSRNASKAAHTLFDKTNLANKMLEAIESAYGKNADDVRNKVIR